MATSSGWIICIDGTVLNAAHIVALEVSEPGISGPDKDTFQVRARTSIGWPTGGYGHAPGHIYVVARGFQHKHQAEEFVLSLTGL